MMYFIYLLMSFLLYSLPVQAKSIDEKIDAVVAPLSDAVSSFVFWPVSISGTEIPLIILWMLIGAVIFTVYTKFIGIWGFKHALKIVRGDYKEQCGSCGEVSSFQALATALSGTVGLGNIAGVAIAITLGGPGATFWMIIGGLLGMAPKFFECTLGVKYRTINPDGSVSGGPMHYLSKGLAKKGMKSFGQFLAVFFALMCIGGALGGGNMLQINQATTQLIIITGGESSFFYTHSWVFGLIIAILIASIIIGGIKSIAKVTEKLVPFMCILYMLAATIVILCNFDKIPATVAMIFQEAFNPNALSGGIIGTIIIGLRRSVQSNEAGIGSAPIAYSAVQTNEPVSQGFVSLLEPFIDTIVLCSMTALVITITGMYTNHNTLSGVELTSSAFSSVIPFFPYILGIAIILFAISTLISWSYYGLKSWTYLVGEGKKRIIVYQLVFCIFIVIGSSMNLASIINFTDAMMLAMAVPNILGMYILMPEVKQDLMVYWNKILKSELLKTPVAATVHPAKESDEKEAATE